MLLERERERLSCTQSDPGPSAFKLKLRRVRPDVAFSIRHSMITVSSLLSFSNNYYIYISPSLWTCVHLIYDENRI